MIYKTGYNGATRTEAEMAVWSGWTGMHHEMRRRVDALIRWSNGRIGVGSTRRTNAQQHNLFTSRYVRVNFKTALYYDRSYWMKKAGVAAAAIPGDSYHEPVLAETGMGTSDTSDATGKCVAADLIDWAGVAGYQEVLKTFGLRNFKGEEWHVQPLEFQSKRSDYNAAPRSLTYWAIPGSVPVVGTRPVVQLGSSGALVRAVQEIIKKVSDASIVVDGKFGPQSVKSWQNYARWYRISDDPSIGGDDWNYLAWGDDGWDRLYAAGFPRQ